MIKTVNLFEDEDILIFYTNDGEHKTVDIIKSDTVLYFDMNNYTDVGLFYIKCKDIGISADDYLKIVDRLIDEM